ncbi:hypothetical protein RchiOBHm_Chr4g0426101 [Rosa chinensis]|uniref:Uncharacterized protein n=1 Tax=Rosa chinensis TaxID=74649 RepID=A0A2P6QZA0_ROSCH|nr:hypothetical protein RchiOBHm_Chr4g0426101 [Rosa chinensis]
MRIREAAKSLWRSLEIKGFIKTSEDLILLQSHIPLEKQTSIKKTH